MADTDIDQNVSFLFILKVGYAYSMMMSPVDESLVVFLGNIFLFFDTMDRLRWC